MENRRTAVDSAASQDWTQGQRSATDVEWHTLDSTHRRPMAGLAGTIRSLENSVSLLLPLAGRWHVRPYARSSADSPGSRRADRLGFVVHRRFVREGFAGFGRRVKKNLWQHPDEPENHALGRSRGGFSSKFHLVTDGAGVPLAVEVTSGQQHESTQVETVLDSIGIPQPIGRPRKRPNRLAGDKAYSIPRIRDWLHAHGIRPVIPRKSNEKFQHKNFDKKSYRRRSVIEQCVGWLKECRRIATRFEKLALSFIAMFKLAMIERYLRITFSDRA